MALIQKAAQSPSMETDMGRGLVDILSRYTQTFLWLQRYDEGLLEEPEGQSGGRLATPEDAIFGNLDQSVFGEPAYPTIESKAAHLLYFVVKNHPLYTDSSNLHSFGIYKGMGEPWIFGIDMLSDPKAAVESFLRECGLKITGTQY